MKNIYKIKKTTITLLTLSFIILTIIEFVKYFCIDSNLFGLNYMIINFIIIFLITNIDLIYSFELSTYDIEFNTIGPSI